MQVKRISRNVKDSFLIKVLGVLNSIAIKRTKSKDPTVIPTAFKITLSEINLLLIIRINCNEKQFKDTSINGIPKFNSKWQTSNNDELIDVVIEKSCSEFINE